VCAVQCFGWQKWPDGTFTGVLRDHVLSLRNVEDPPGHYLVEYLCHHAPSGAASSAHETALRDLFNTEVCDPFHAMPHPIYNQVWISGETRHNCIWMGAIG
jgi:hypothetical protein